MLEDVFKVSKNESPEFDIQLSWFIDDVFNIQLSFKFWFFESFADTISPNSEDIDVELSFIEVAYNCCLVIELNALFGGCFSHFSLAIVNVGSSFLLSFDCDIDCRKVSEVFCGCTFEDRFKSNSEKSKNEFCWDLREFDDEGFELLVKDSKNERSVENIQLSCYYYNINNNYW